MARIASSDWLTTFGASWLDSNTSPATTTNSAPVSRATLPSAATASRRAAENRAWASASRKLRVMPNCQSAVCRNFMPPNVEPGTDKSAERARHVP